MADQLRARIQDLIAPMRVQPGTKVRLPRDFDPGYSQYCSVRNYWPVDGVLLGLRPWGVVGAFDVPLDVLALDDPGVGACTSWRVEPGDEAVQEGQPGAVAGVRVVRGESRPGGRWTGG